MKSISKPNIRVMSLFLIFSFVITSCEDGLKFPWSKDEEPQMDSVVTETEVWTDEVVEEPVDSGDVYVEEEVVEEVYAEPETNRKQWRLVISSVQNQDNARSLVERLQVSSAEVIYVSHLDTYRVVYASFDDLNQAQAQFEDLQRSYPEAWLVYF